MQPVLSNRFIIIIVVFDIRERNNSQHFLRTTKKMTRFSSTPIKDHMISKYLGNHRGNQNNVTKQVQDKLQGTIKELFGKEVGVYRHVTIM